MIKPKNPMEVGESLRRKQNRIIRKLLAGQEVLGIYLIINPYNKENSFDIVESKMLSFSYYREREITLYGIAGSLNEAKGLVPRIVERNIC